MTLMSEKIIFQRIQEMRPGNPYFLIFWNGVSFAFSLDSVSPLASVLVDEVILRMVAAPR